MKLKAMATIAALTVSLPAMLAAEPDDDTLVVNGEIEMVTKTAAPDHMRDAIGTIMSG